MNSVNLVGRLGQDPEMRNTSSGKAVCTLNVATDGFSGGEKTTEWHRVVVWEKQAESAAKYLSKGSQVSVEGRLQTRKWEKDGENRYTTEIIAHRVGFLGGKGSGERAPAEARPKPAEPAGGYDDLNSDIPFISHERNSII